MDFSGVCYEEERSLEVILGLLSYWLYGRSFTYSAALLLQAYYVRSFTYSAALLLQACYVQTVP